MLLQHGAPANGIRKNHLSRHALSFRRFCEGDRSRLSDYFVEVEPESVGLLRAQIGPDKLTASEMEERRSRTSRFWAEPSSKEIDYLQSGELMHSVLAAVTTTRAILDLVLESGANTTAWTENAAAISTFDESELESSYLCTSTPLHAAIASRNATMLRTILQRGFDPNARALATGSQALTPAQYAMILGDTESLSILMSNARTHVSILTPVFHVHINHFAAAQLRLDLLLSTHIPLSDTLPTALGHTLLHIACLPLDKHAIPANSPKIQQSVHDVRFMMTKRRFQPILSENDWHSSGEWILSNTHSTTRGARDYWSFRPRPITTVVKQSEIVKHIVNELGSAHTIGARDVYENTPLHYLAAISEQNAELVGWLGDQDGGDVWSKARNFWGYTPLEVSEEGEAASLMQTAYGAGGRGGMLRGRSR